MKMKSSKGQTALEVSLVLLFIILSVAALNKEIAFYSANIQRMAEARALAQGKAFELTMGGTTTHLIRADQNTTSLPFSVDLFVVSEDCDAANSEISESLSYADIEIKNFICDSGLFADRD